MWATSGGTQFLGYMSLYMERRAEVREWPTEELNSVLATFDPSQEPWYIRGPYKLGLLPDPVEIKAIKDELVERVENASQN